MWLGLVDGALDSLSGIKFESRSRSNVNGCLIGLPLFELPVTTSQVNACRVVAEGGIVDVSGEWHLEEVLRSTGRSTRMRAWMDATSVWTLVEIS